MKDKFISYNEITEDIVQSYIQKNKIHTVEELYHSDQVIYYIIKSRNYNVVFTKLSVEEKARVRVRDLNRFIKRHKISSENEFKEKYNSLFKFILTKNGWLDKIKYYSE